jgi:acetyltransferase-like isoleucine patch superfamily enzyme
MSFLGRDEIDRVGFASVGENVLLSDRASFHNPAGIAFGDNVRVDDFCVLSAGAGGIRIGSFVHVAVYSSIVGADEIVMEDFAGLSSRVSIYSSNDDYSGRTMTNPTVPDEYKVVEHAPVHIGRHVIVGTGSIVLPGVTLHEGVAIGALSLVRESCEPFTIHAGVPARQVGERKRDLLELERKFRLERGSSS